MYKNKEGRKERLLKLIEKGLNNAEIADIEQVSAPTVSRWISKIDENEVEEARRKAKEAKEKRLLKLIEGGLTEEQIADKETVSVATVSIWIRQIDKNKVEEARRKGKEVQEEARRKAEEERKEELLKLIGEGLKQREIAAIKEVSESIVKYWISKIDKNEVKEARRRAKEERVLKLIGEGLKRREIAAIEQVSESTVEYWISKIDKDKVKKAREKARKVRNELRRREHKEEARRKKLKQKLDNHTITKKEIIEYRKELDNKHDLIIMDEILLMLNIYIKTKQLSKAISFIDSLVNDENIKIDKNKLKQLKKQIIRTQKKQEIRRLLAKDLSISAIASKTGIEETEVIKIINEIKMHDKANANNTEKEL